MLAVIATRSLVLLPRELALVRRITWKLALPTSFSLLQPRGVDRGRITLFGIRRSRCIAGACKYGKKPAGKAVSPRAALDQRHPWLLVQGVYVQRGTLA